MFFYCSYRRPHRDNFASFKCRVIKNNSNGKFDNTIDVHIETYSTVEIVILWLILCLF